MVERITEAFDCNSRVLLLVSFLAFPTVLTTYTRDTFCLLPLFLTFASDPGDWVLSSTRFGRPSSQVHFRGVLLQLSLRSVRSVPFREDPGVVSLSFRTYQRGECL